MTYTKEDLISELKRFYEEKGFVPAALNMKPKFGYPSYVTYINYFSSWNNALEVAELKTNEIHRKLDGTEICLYCGKHADEIHNFIQWYYHDDIRYCHKHGNSGKGGLPDYVKGILDINSNVGRGRAGEICVIKALKIGNEYDCNKLSCGYSFDMYNDEYGKIDVKTFILSDKNNVWNFKFGAKKMTNTYICLGMSSDTKNIEHVWIVSNEGKFRHLTGFKIVNTEYSLSTHEEWEVDKKIYVDAWQKMLNNYTDGKCKVFGKKGD